MAAKLERFNAVRTGTSIRTSPSYKFIAKLTVQYHDLMGRVHVKAVAEGESDSIVKRRIGRTVVGFNWCLSETGYQLLHIANSFSPSNR
jgi:hypothetical protein